MDGIAQRSQVTLYDNVTPVAIVSSTNATPSVVTATAHGLSVGQRVLIQGHATNTAINGIFQVTAVATNTFTLGDEITGANVAGNGVGGATGFCLPAPPVSLLTDFKAIDYSVVTGGNATVTFQFLSSIGATRSLQTQPRGDYPNIGATVTASNPVNPLNITDLKDGSAIAGPTGIVVAGTDISDQYEVNINLTKWGTLVPTSWSAGSFSVKGIFKSGI